MPLHTISTDLEILGTPELGDHGFHLFVLQKLDMSWECTIESSCSHVSDSHRIQSNPVSGVSVSTCGGLATY